MACWIVPDTCALAASLFQEIHSPRADPMLRAIRVRSVDAVAPTLGIAEFLNVSRKKIAGHTFQGVVFPPLSPTVVDGVIADFLALPILWADMESIAAGAWKLHRTHGVQTGDAFFLQLAMRWQAELWTTDQPFHQSSLAVHAASFDLQAVTFA